MADNLSLVLTFSIQAQHLSLFGHITRLNDCADAKILTAFPPEDWKRPLGRRLRITWVKIVLNDLESHNLTLTEAVSYQYV